MIPSFISRLTVLGDSPAAVDLVFDEIEDLALFKQYDVVKEELRALSASKLPTGVLISALTATLPWKNMLRFERILLADHIRKVAIERGEDEDTLLEGLL